MDDAEIRKYIFKAAPQSRTSTSLSCFIHTIRLRRIESSIQQSVYRVDKTSNLPHKVIDRFLAELNIWKQLIPDEPVVDDIEIYSYDGYDYHLLYYYKCLRLLLYPNLTAPDVSTHLLIKCAEACGGVCRLYKQLHRQTSVGFSLMALYSIFLSGLTLLYCMWLSPKEVYTIATSNDLNACSIVLYVITERWPGARRYRDAFESIRQCVLDLIADGNSQPRKPLTGLDAELRTTLQDVQSLHPEGRAEFSRMMTDMIGESECMQMASVPMQQHQIPMFHEMGSEQQGIGSGMVYQNGQEMVNFYAMGNPASGDMQAGALQAMDMIDDFDMEEILAGLNPMGPLGEILL